MHCPMLICPGALQTFEKKKNNLAEGNELR